MASPVEVGVPCRIICMDESLNHLSLEDARKYLDDAWNEYKQFFVDKSTDLGELAEKIMEVNSKFNLPWYKRYYG